jgi:hypothetical protein
VKNEHYTVAQSICEEMAQRGLLIGDPNVMLYLNRCIALNRNNKKNNTLKEEE